MKDQILDDELMLESPVQNWRYAGFWIRAGATLIDLLVYSPFIALSFYNLFTIKNFSLQLFLIVIQMAYKPIMEYTYGGTLGKMAVKIKVVGGQTEKLSLSQSIIRYSPWLISDLISIYSAILLFNNITFLDATDFESIGRLEDEKISNLGNILGFFFFFISCIVVAFNQRKQGLHDKIANTYCVYK